MQNDIAPPGVSAVGPPAPPFISPADPGEASGPRLRVLLRGETEPRLCTWDPSDLTQVADLDQAVGGLEHLDITRLWHMLALFWVACAGAREEMSLREFGRAFPWGGAERSAALTKGAAILWRQIT